MNLQTQSNPHPYKLQWFQKGKGLLVEKGYLVDFSIGKTCKDSIWCDVVPMDACHLLLGILWQFDRRVFHDGYKNTYSFVKDGVQITLAPMTPNSLSKEQKGCGNVIFYRFTIGEDSC